MRDKKGGILTHKAVDLPLETTFGEIFTSLSPDLCMGRGIVKILGKDSMKSSGVQVQPTIQLLLAQELNFKYTEYEVCLSDSHTFTNLAIIYFIYIRDLSNLQVW